jgi:hypothetical protein
MAASLPGAAGDLARHWVIYAAFVVPKAAVRLVTN